MLQSSRRENLVRLHFGLFVQCAEGLEFLKAYRKGGACLFIVCIFQYDASRVSL